MYLVVGLGNPGRQYFGTRHNLGFEVIEELAIRHNLNTFKDKHNSLLGEFTLAGQKIIIAQPQTFMNNSGQSVRDLLFWYKLPPSYLIVVNDDADLEVGELRIREKGNSAGHKGLESIINSIGTSDFIRIRMGIGREEAGIDITNYVLQKIPPSQEEKLKNAVFLAADAVEEIVKFGLSSAMNKFNGPC